MNEEEIKLNEEILADPTDRQSSAIRAASKKLKELNKQLEALKQPT